MVAVDCNFVNALEIGQRVVVAIAIVNVMSQNKRFCVVVVVEVHSCHFVVADYCQSVHRRVYHIAAMMIVDHSMMIMLD